MMDDSDKGRVFLGIGFGPIQTGIFLSGADGNFERIAVAEIDSQIVNAVRKSNGKITINIAEKDRIYKKIISNIEIYNPLVNEDLDELINLASCADEIATALPSVSVFAKIAGWLGAGLSKNLNKRIFVYTAENHNHAAEILQKTLNLRHDSLYFLNTVIGKMSGVLPGDECMERGLDVLCDGADRGHLAEEFNNILISDCPGIECRRIDGLNVKKNLLPYEEAKLYGHNAVHLLLGLHASFRGLNYMCELRNHKDIMKIGREAFIEESGTALLRKWQNEDDFFDESGFRDYSEDLLVRMTNPFLMDSVERVCRDLERKLGWDDRIVGTIRLCLSQSVPSPRFAKCARMASERLFKSSDSCEIRKRLLALWGNSGLPEEMEAVIELILRG